MDSIAKSGVVLDCKEAREVMVMSVSVLAVSKQKNKAGQGISLPMMMLQARWKQIRDLELEQASSTVESISPLRVPSLSSYREESYAV